MKQYRKYFAIFVVLAMLFAMVSPSVATAAVDYSYIKVLMSSMNVNGCPSSVQFKVDGAYRISEASSVELYKNVTYTIKTDGSSLKLSYSNGASTVAVSLPATATFVQYASSSAHNFIYVNNPDYGWTYYSGNMAFSLAHDKKTNKDFVQLINAVYLETYLYGVISYEMGNDWPVEALKAQAVAARTYAVRYIKANPGASYHMPADTSACQVYRGFPFDSSGNAMQNVINAVDGTRGKVIVIGDPSNLNFADGVYSASNGGQIRTANMKWGSANTYHVFKDDPYDLANSASPSFQYIFPVTNDAATMNLLNANDQNKAQSMLAIIKTKLPAALLAQQKIACDPTAITINGISAADPSAPRADEPQGTREFTKVTVTVNVTASGTSQPKPHETVTGLGNALTPGAATPSADNGTDFGSAVVGADIATQPQETFYILNGGTAALNISGIAISGANSGDFTLSNPLPTKIDASGNAAFTVTFNPSATGVRAATVTIMSDDHDNPSFAFAIQGTGTTQAQQSAQIITNSFQPSDQQAGPVTSDASETSDDTQSGGGGMPDIFTGNVTVDLGYVSQASDGKWNVFGELRTQFSNYNKYLNSLNYWELYSSASSDGKFLYVTARGFGHGVGLSQRGAQEMAREGKLCGDILDFYYNMSAGKSGTATLSTTAKTLSQIPGNSTKTWGKVTAATMNVRATNSTSGTIEATLPKDTIVEILSTSGSWYKVLQNSTGLIGYAVTSSIAKSTTGPTAPPATATPTPATPTPSGATPTPAATATPVMGRVDSSTLTMRALPNANSAAVYTLEKNDIVIVLDAYAGDNWYKVKYASYVGYCVSAGTTAAYIDIAGSEPTPTGTATTPPSTGPITPPTVTGKVNISSGTLTVHSSASKTSSQKGTLNKGATVTVVAVSSTDKTWLQISTSSVSGYVKAQYIAISGNTSYRACTITSANINVRGGAGTTYPTIGTVTKNNTFACTQVITSGSYTWYKIYCGSALGYGYVSSQFARLSSTS